MTKTRVETARIQSILLIGFRIHVHLDIDLFMYLSFICIIFNTFCSSDKIMILNARLKARNRRQL
jgi:hypothetical protein